MGRGRLRSGAPRPYIYGKSVDDFNRDGLRLKLEQVGDAKLCVKFLADEPPKHQELGSFVFCRHDGESSWVESGSLWITADLS
jgi:hypothetical protein